MAEQRLLWNLTRCFLPAGAGGSGPNKALQCGKLAQNAILNCQASGGARRTLQDQALVRAPPRIGGGLAERQISNFCLHHWLLLTPASQGSSRQNGALWMVTGLYKPRRCCLAGVEFPGNGTGSLHHLISGKSIHVSEPRSSHLYQAPNQAAGWVTWRLV